MKISIIQNLTLDKFEKELSKENYLYILKTYGTLQNALESYIEGAEESCKDEYLEINEYFDIIKDCEDN